MVLRRVKKAIAKKSKRKTAKPKRACKAKKVSINEEMLNHMIQERAYYLWEEKGNPCGCDYDIWVQAEKDILTKVTKR